MQSSDILRTDFDTWKIQLNKHKKECGVAEINTPGTTKDSRKALHDTSNATDAVKDWRSFWTDVLDEETFSAKSKAQQKTVDDFLDTIYCALEEMNGKEVFDCFVKAVKSQHEYTKKEYYKTIDLMDLLSVL